MLLLLLGGGGWSKTAREVIDLRHVNSVQGRSEFHSKY